MVEVMQKTVDGIFDKFSQDIEGLHRRFDSLNEDFFRGIQKSEFQENQIPYFEGKFEVLAQKISHKSMSLEQTERKNAEAQTETKVYECREVQTE